MHTAQVNFLGSFNKNELCPKPKLPEYAFIGRSNVGKSSLINMITGRKSIAKVSSTPGKTQMINYFEIDERWHLVDLPGYGYAKISKTKRAQWKKMINRFLEQRETLVCTFLLIDSRIPLQQIDLDFANYLGQAQIPYVIVFTKLDKVRPTQREANIERIKNGLLEHWESLPQCFETSAQTKLGQSELLEFIASINSNI